MAVVIAGHGSVTTECEVVHTLKPIGGVSMAVPTCEPGMASKCANLQIVLALLLSAAAAVVSAPDVRRTMTEIHPRPFADVVNEVVAGVATGMRIAPATD